MAREAPSSSGSGRQRPLPPGDPSAPPVRGYTLIRRIGAGSYGEVWLGYGTVGRWHAAKIVRRDAFESKETYQRELRGLRAYVPVSEEQPDLLRIFHAEGTDDEGCFYYVMELADARKPVAQATPASSKKQGDDATSSGHEGDWDWDDYTPRTLKSDLAAHEPLPFAQCLETAGKIATALGHLHARGLVHRDVKPSNIVFVRNEAKLADIGLVAKMEQSLSVSRVGAAGYMPEEGASTPSGDLYALGKVLYEMATGYSVDRYPVLPLHEEAGKFHRGILDAKPSHSKSMRDAAERSLSERGGDA